MNRVKQPHHSERFESDTRTIIEPREAHNDHVRHQKATEHEENINTEIAGENHMRAKQGRQKTMLVEYCTSTV